MQNHFSPSAASLLCGLLERDVEKRLGSSKKDWNELKVHPFFKTIDWNQIALQTHEAPYIPQLKDEFDLKFMDKNLTK